MLFNQIEPRIQRRRSRWLIALLAMVAGGCGGEQNQQEQDATALQNVTAADDGGALEDRGAQQHENARDAGIKGVNADGGRPKEDDLRVISVGGDGGAGDIGRTRPPLPDFLLSPPPFPDFRLPPRP